jgi:hypothetical protein
VLIGFAAGTVPETRGQVLPTLPQNSVDTSYPAQTGTTISVPAGGDFQGALDRAQLGDTITLQAGATYSGSFTLGAKNGNGWIVVRTSSPDSSLPAQGRRITPSYASVLPKIVANDTIPALQTAAGAHHYRFVGVEITTAANLSMSYGLVYFGTDYQSSSGVPSYLILDRVYIHGQPNNNMRRGVAMNSAWTAVIDSYISECHEVGADSQAIAGWNGPGPFKIVNNYLEGAGENVIFGGADPSITNLVPADIEIRGNHVNKPLRWKSGDPSYDGSQWSIKNLLELKNARRVLIDGNIFEHNWIAAQSGFGILFTPRNQSGGAPWSAVEDVTFTDNIVRHSAQGVNMLGWDDINSSQQMKRVLVRNDVWEDVSLRLFQVRNGTVYVTIDHNTAFQGGEFIVGDPAPNLNFYYTNNIQPNNQYGMGGTGTFGNPSATLSQFYPGAVFRRNVIQGGDASAYPPDNFFPLTMADVRFVDLAGGNYHLATSSPYKNAGTDGKDVGADIDAVNAATAGVLNGTTPGNPPPPPPADTTPPSVAITAPANGATVLGTTTISADASDNVGVAGVKFFVDGSIVGAEDTSAPFSVSWDSTKVANGSHTLTAVARDAAGNTTTSAPRNVTVSNPPPTQSPFTGTPFAVPGQFEAEDFDKGGEGIAYHDLALGNQGGLYRLTEDVDIISPYAGGYAVNNFQTGEWLEYTINVTQSGTYRIEALVSSMYTTSQYHVEIDGIDKTGAVGVPNTGAWGTFQWVGKDGISLSAGQHILRITADVEYFNLDAIRLSLSGPPPDTTPPTVAITAPANGATVLGPTTISANASDNVGVAGVQFWCDGTKVGAEDTAAPYSVSWDTTKVANGSHTLTAVARDAAGNTSTSAPVNVTVSNASTQSPFTGTPFAVPGQFEAEDFDKGGEGIAYHDLASGNQGGLYRLTEDVDIISPYTGGYAVNNFQTGEWLEYTINVTQSGTYRIEALVSSMYTTSQYHVEIDGTDKTGAVVVPNTGSWGTFQWVGKDGIMLAAGQHVLRITADVEYFNLDAIRLSTNGQLPYLGLPFAVPGQFEAEDFDKGGEGIAYHDLTSGNLGGLYRTGEDVDIISPYAGGYAVNNFQTGEWLEYTINVTQSGTYRVEALISSTSTNGKFHIDVDGVDVTGMINVPNTGAWGTFQWVAKNGNGIALTAGQHVLRIEADAQYCNLDAIRIN